MPAEKPAGFREFGYWKSLCRRRPSIKDIADRLHVSEGAVKKYRAGTRAFGRWDELLELAQPDEAKSFARKMAETQKNGEPGHIMTRGIENPDAFLGLDRHVSALEIEASKSGLAETFLDVVSVTRKAVRSLDEELRRDSRSIELRIRDLEQLWEEAVSAKQAGRKLVGAWSAAPSFFRELLPTSWEQALREGPEDEIANWALAERRFLQERGLLIRTREVLEARSFQASSLISRLNSIATSASGPAQPAL